MGHFRRVVLPVCLINPFNASNGCDFGANQGMVDAVQPKDRHTRIIACALEIAVNKNIGEILSIPGDQVHCQKGHIADHIDVAQFRAELYTVKGNNTGWQPHEISQVQITMTLPDESVFLSLNQCRLQVLQVLAGPRRKALQFVPTNMRFQVLDIRQHWMSY